MRPGSPFLGLIPGPREQVECALGALPVVRPDVAQHALGLVLGALRETV